MNGSYSRSRWWKGTWPAVALAFGVLAAAPAPSIALDRSCEKRSPVFDVAERLADLADRLAEESMAWRHAAELMLQSADLRPECTLEHVEALRNAATYFRFAGDFEKASAVSYRAAERGVWNGQVTVAAEAFIDAATYALEAGDEGGALTAARHASRLAGSPLLTHMQRLTIQGRADRLIEREASGLERRPSPGRPPSWPLGL